MLFVSIHYKFKTGLEGFRSVFIDRPEPKCIQDFEHIKGLCEKHIEDTKGCGVLPVSECEIIFFKEVSK